MKMRRTIYPLALAISIPLVILTFFIMNQGHFEQVDTVTFSANKLPEINRMMESHLEWKGVGKPKIESIRFDDSLKNDEWTIFLADEFNEIKTYHEKLQSTRTVSYQHTDTQTEKKVPVLSILVDKSPSEVNPIEIRIQYKTFGITREQKIDITELN